MAEIIKYDFYMILKCVFARSGLVLTLSCKSFGGNERLGGLIPFTMFQVMWEQARVVGSLQIMSANT